MLCKVAAQVVLKKMSLRSSIDTSPIIKILHPYSFVGLLVFETFIKGHTFSGPLGFFVGVFVLFTAIYKGELKAIQVKNKNK